MGRYVCRRLLGTLPVALAVSLIVFLVVNVLPGDPVQAMFGPGESVAPEVLAALRTSLGLDRSLPERYALELRVSHIMGLLGLTVEGALEELGLTVDPAKPTGRPTPMGNRSRTWDAEEILSSWELERIEVPADADDAVLGAIGRALLVDFKVAVGEPQAILWGLTEALRRRRGTALGT